MAVAFSISNASMKVRVLRYRVRVPQCVRSLSKLGRPEGCFWWFYVNKWKVFFSPGKIVRVWYRGNPQLGKLGKKNARRGNEFLSWRWFGERVKLYLRRRKEEKRRERKKKCPRTVTKMRESRKRPNSRRYLDDECGKKKWECGALGDRINILLDTVG